MWWVVVRVRDETEARFDSSAGGGNIACWKIHFARYSVEFVSLVQDFRGDNVEELKTMPSVRRSDTSAE
jgi:hypothetical protein